MLTSKQRSYLRSLASSLDPIFQIGKGGIGDAMCTQLDQTLEARELIKIRTLETSPISPKEAGEVLSERLGCDCVQVIGSRIVLYRPSKEKPQIELP